MAWLKQKPDIQTLLRHRRIESRSVGIQVGQGGSCIGAERSNCEC